MMAFDSSAININCVGIDKEKVFSLLSGIDMASFSPDKEYIAFPGFCDVHVHLREPGFSCKETIKTGTAAAAAGGYTCVCAMPNLSPVPDSVENLNLQREIIERDALIPVLPYGAISIGEKGEALAELEGMAPYVCAFSDDGRGVQDDKMMEEAMLRAKKLGRIIAAHCEVNELVRGGYIHEGEYARAHGHKGICSESEYAQIARDIELVRRTGCAYHVCHVSAKESVELIRKAKAEGLNITCETGPHYLVMDDSQLQEEGRFKMNPPIRSREDREALIAGILDGTVDMIATDHAPHTAEEKSRGLAGSLMGIVGLETAFAVLYTKLVRPGILSLEKLCELMSARPRERFGIEYDAGLTVFEVSEEYSVEPESFMSMGRATPFDGWRVHGRCVLTMQDGKAVYSAL